jgi:hypothetical protein
MSSLKVSGEALEHEINQVSGSSQDEDLRRVNKIFSDYTFEHTVEITRKGAISVKKVPSVTSPTDR